MHEKTPDMCVMPTLALRGLTIFPSTLLHFDVGRAASTAALEEAMATGQPIFLVAQRDLATEEPDQRDLYPMGTISTVRQILRLPGDNVRVMVEGNARGKLVQLTQREPFLLAQVERLEPVPYDRNSPRSEALVRQTYELFEEYTERSPKTTEDVLIHILASDDAGYIADYVAQNMVMRAADKQAILEELRPLRRLEKFCHILRREIEVLTMEQDLQEQVRSQLLGNQRDYFLREQMKVIEQELGEGSGDETSELAAQIAAAKLPEEVHEKLIKEFRRMQKQPFGSAEATVSRNYLEVCLALPWSKLSLSKVRVAAVEKALNEDHFGLDKVKERILEYVAVRQLAPDLKGQILCLVGPPGVGKTSIATSIARAMHRKFARISLGGIHDEAEIRGHRKTYIGAMPGRIIEAMRAAGTLNPVILLDEIDKLGTDQRGDPASALLEALDSAQNATFRDHFLELPFDLSNVVFITTANAVDTIPRPLLDRMECIEVPSYTDEEKLQIAKKFLLPKALKRHCLAKKQMKITDAALRVVIDGYTSESGVRQLEREVSALCRKAAMAVVSDTVKEFSVTDDGLAGLLGPIKYHPEAAAMTPQIGLVNGLAWTQVGGKILQVEVNVVPGSGKLELTGNLGDVMKESARAALSFVRSHADTLGIDAKFYQTKDIHVHFPEGAVPKDGPSAGVAIVVAMVSALTGAPVRRALAMTGEVTLRGRVLPIGGLREKTMAALRGGLTTVLIPEENVSDLEEIDQSVRKRLNFIPVAQAEAALAFALEPIAAQGIDVQGAVTELEIPMKRAPQNLNLKQ